MNKNTRLNTLKVSPEFIRTLKEESHKVFSACIRLNADKKYNAAVKTIVDTNFKNTHYKSEHLLMRDLVKIYNDFFLATNNSKTVPLEAKFILLFFYEKIQGKDLIASYTKNEINKLLSSSLFEKNILIIRETSFFQPIEEIASEFVSTAVLLKTRNNEFQNIASYINRITLLISNADYIVCEKEKILLKQITDSVNNPKILIKEETYNEVPENDTLDIVLKELHELVGLDTVKKNIQDLINYLKVQKLREDKGLKTSKNSLHTVFMGPPGTGKTTVARMLGRIYKHLGYLKKGHLIETDRASLVAGYVGQTAIKTDEIITTAIGGVLFIDEAYALASGGLNDFGSEAIETLLKRMEDYRNNLVVVVAGYPDEMEIFIQSNPGLQSRFNRYFKFDHFDPVALLKIFNFNAKKTDFKLTKDAEDKLNEIIERVYKKRHRGFGNARTMRNLFEKITERHANRIVLLKEITKQDLITITEEDIPEVLKTVQEILVFSENNNTILK